MVLESLIGESNIRKHPFFMCLLAFVISIGSIFFATQVSPAHPSIISIAFITIGLVPLVYNVLTQETEEEAHERRSCTTFFARHFDIILIYIWIFIGVILAFACAYVASPSTMRASLFEEQISAFCSISGECKGNVPYSITGNAASIAFDQCRNPETSNAYSCSRFILENNGKVLFLTIILSLLYGAGAVFVIAWNAGILGVFFGEMILMGQHVKSFGFLQSMLIGHGPPELLSYVFGALAGAILSAMIARGQLFTHSSKVIFKDVLFLLGLAIFSVVYGALTEAVGILRMADLYYVLGFLYVFVIIIIVLLYGRKRNSGCKLAF